MARVLRWIVSPSRLRSGSVRVPGDKSITHRAFLCGLLGAGETVIHGANPGDDTRATLAATRLLGAEVAETSGEIRMIGTGGAIREPDRVIDCGNSGTALRLLSGVLAGHRVFAVLTGDDSLRGRPVDRVIQPLRAMGAHPHARAGDRLPPLMIHGGDLTGRSFDEPTGSAQVASAILFAGLVARGETRVRVKTGVRDHTVRMLAAFGARVEAIAASDGGATWSVTGPQTLRGARLRVPGDPSAAAFLMAAAAATPGARVTLEGIGLNPTRLGFVDTLREMGAGIAIRNGSDQAGEPVGDVEVEGPEALRAADIPAARVPSMVDEVPAWAVLAARARGTSRLSGAGELRLKESDRLKSLAANLRSLGVAVEESAEGLAVTGGPARGGTVRAGGDHRIAMAFAVLATLAEGPVEIDDAAMVATSYPDFASALRERGGQLEEREAD
jgi:3-phosphoshikimate 1-carboxyvinyltransferase